MHCSLLYLSATLWILPLFFIPGPLQIDQIDQNTGTFLLIWGVHLLYGIGHLKLKKDSGSGSEQFLEEILLVLAGIGFLITYIFAPMQISDYVQWFIQSGGNLKLAPDSRTSVHGLLYFDTDFNPRRKRDVCTECSEKKPDRGGLFLFLPLQELQAYSFPSFVASGRILVSWHGSACSALICFCTRTNWKTGVIMELWTGFFTSTLINFWLGTFSLVISPGGYFFRALCTGYVHGIFHSLLKKVSREYRCIMTAALWTIFEYGRSLRFSWISLRGF